MNLRPLLYFLEAHPFLKLLVPFVIGICTADVCQECIELSLSNIVLFLCFLWLAMYLCHKYSRIIGTSWFGLTLFVFMLLTGFVLTLWHWQAVKIEWSEQAATYEALLTDTPSRKPRSTQCPVKLLKIEGKELSKKDQKQILLYLPLEDSSLNLQAGEIIRFNGRITPPKAFTETFDYARYLYHNHTSGTVYTRRWKKTNNFSQELRYYSLRLRSKILEYYTQSGLKNDELAIYSAITLGYKKFISDDIKTIFTQSGASHVLALSGLHIGILCAVITSFFGLFFTRTRKRIVCPLLAIPFVWGFIYLSGMPISAIRAAIMFTAWAIGNAITRPGYPINTLAFTAFFMLLYNPFYLYDVGFQLSFSAVAAILLINPWLRSQFPIYKNRINNYLLDIITVSIAAQIGILPLTLYYFHQLSSYFLLVNLWLIPLVFLLLTLAIPYILLCFIPIYSIQELFAQSINQILKCTNDALIWFNHLPGANINNIFLNISEVCCLYLALFVFFYGFIHKQRKSLIILLGILCFEVFLRIINI